MEVVGYILGGLTLIVGLAIRLVRGLDKTLLDTIRAIQDEFELAYRDLGTSMGEEPRLGMSLGRLKGLHYYSQKDLLKIRVLEWILGKIPAFIWFVFLLAVISVALGRIFLDEKRSLLKGVFLLGVPIVLLASEFVLLGWILRAERYLNRAIEFYRRTQYRL